MNDWILSTQEQAEIAPLVMSLVPSVPTETEQWAEVASLFQPAPEIVKQIPRHLSFVQQDLFLVDPEKHDYRQQMLEEFPTPIADFFAKRYQQRLKRYGSNGVMAFFEQEVADFRPRIIAVLDHYADTLNAIEADPVDYQFLDRFFPQEIPANENRYQREIRRHQQLSEFKATMPEVFTRLEQQHHQLRRSRNTPLAFQTETQLKYLADHLAFLMHEMQEDYVCRHSFALNPDDPDSPRQILLGLYCYLIDYCDRYRLHGICLHIDQARKGTITNAQLNSALLRLVCDKHCLRKLKKCAERMSEHLAIAMGRVTAYHGGYVSQQRVILFKQKQKANYEYIKACILVDMQDPAHQAELLDIWLKTQSNPKIRRLELMNRIRAFEMIAEWRGDCAVFVTLTCPSQYHAMLSTGGVNPKWNGENPKQAQQHLCGQWAKVRSAIDRREIPIYGFRMAEPHQDGTPHWHLLIWLKPEQVDEFKRIFRHYALEIDPHEPGANEHRIKFEDIDPAKGGATAYISKYISKNTDGYGMQGELDFELSGERGELSDPKENVIKDSAVRVIAWARCWGIRQFQQIGGAPITPYRELRRLGDKKIDDEQLDLLRVVSDVGCVVYNTNIIYISP